MKSIYRNEQRDAWYILRGYVYQVDLTIEQWLKLEDKHVLQLECGEDFDISPWLENSIQFDRLLGQVKHLGSRLTLNTDEATIAIANFLEHQKVNNSLSLFFCFVTNTRVTKEKKSPLNAPAITVWEQLRNKPYLDEDDQRDALNGILSILKARSKPKKLNNDTWGTYKKFFTTATPDDLYQKLVSKFQWNVEQTTSDMISSKIQQLLIELRYTQDETTAEMQYRYLFFHVVKLLTNKGIKQLTRDDREKVLQSPVLDANNNKLFERVIKHLAHIRTIDELYSSNPLFPYLTDLFVPPKEFEAIKHTLSIHNAIFLISNPHMGKTFTAIYLLLMYSQQGYKIEWLFRDDPRLSIFGRLQGTDYSNFEKIPLEKRTILYLEDPYGQSERDLNYSQNLKLSLLLQRLFEITDASDLYPPKIVITLRKSMWQYVTENVDPELKNYVYLQSSISYSDQNRQEILRKYINHIKPAWANHLELRNQVVENVSKSLVAPHNIYWFVERSKKQTEWLFVMATIQRSAEITTALAHEIDLLSPLEQLVFITVYVTTYWPTVQSFANSMAQAFFLGNLDTHLKCYHAFATVLGYGADANLENFVATLRAWKEIFSLPRVNWDRLTAEEGELPVKYRRLIKVTFQHTSYSEAVSRFIEKGRLKTIFSELGNRIQELIRNSQFQKEGIALIHPLLVHKTSLRPTAITQIRSLFVQEPELVKTRIIEALLANYHQFPQELEPIFDALDPNKDKEIWYLFMKTAWPNYRISREKRLKLWQLALGQGTIYPSEMFLGPIHPLEGPFIFFETLPEGLQQIFLRHLESRSQWSWYCLAYPLTEYYSRLPNHVQKWLFVLADEGNEYVFLQIILALVNNYEKLPSQVTDLLEKFAKASNWKRRAYTATWFRDKLDSLLPSHKKLIEHLILHDRDVRVRMSPLYTELQLLGMGSYHKEQVSLSDIYLKLVFSERLENQVGTLFVLSSSAENLHLVAQASELKVRLAELLTSQEPMIEALVKYVLSNENETITIQSDDSRILAYKKTVEDFADDVISVYMGPR